MWFSEITNVLQANTFGMLSLPCLGIEEMVTQTTGEEYDHH